MLTCSMNHMNHMFYYILNIKIMSLSLSNFSMASSSVLSMIVKCFIIYRANAEQYDVRFHKSSGSP